MDYCIERAQILQVYGMRKNEKGRRRKERRKAGGELKKESINF